MATRIPSDNSVHEAPLEGLSKPLAHDRLSYKQTLRPLHENLMHNRRQIQPKAIRDGVPGERTINTLLPVIRKPQTNSLLTMSYNLIFYNTVINHACGHLGTTHSVPG